MLDQVLLKKYAQLILKIGVNLQKNQSIYIKSSPENYDFVCLITKEAYLLGASKVNILWKDTTLNYYDLKYASLENLIDNDIQLKNYQKIVENEAIYISFISPIPGLTSDISTDRLKSIISHQKEQFIFFDNYIKGIKNQWTTMVIPNKIWAKKIFPNLSPSKALKKIWDIVFKSCFIDHQTDFILSWENHNQKLLRYRQILNNFNFKYLFFKNKLGTDLKVGLIPNHIWHGGYVVSENKKVIFNPNMPMYEVLTMPHRNEVYGKLVTTKPLNFKDKIIDKLQLQFEKGKVVAFDAKTEKSLFNKILNMDSNSSYLGEIALVPQNSFLSQLNILFFETLLDENTSCHLALGQSYPATVQNGLIYSKKDLLSKGSNCSSIHVDICFGSDDLELVGQNYEGEKHLILKNGNFVF